MILNYKFPLLQSCMNNSGMCTQRNQCKGTVYKDRYNECEGSVCCATLTPAVILPTGKVTFQIFIFYSRITIIDRICSPVLTTMENVH